MAVDVKAGMVHQRSIIERVLYELKSRQIHCVKGEMVSAAGVF